MDTIIVAVGLNMVGVGLYLYVRRTRPQMTAGPRRLFDGSAALLAAACACTFAGLLLISQEVRAGVAIAAIVLLGIVAVRSLRGVRGLHHARIVASSAAQPQWKNAAIPPAPPPAVHSQAGEWSSPTVRAIENMEVAA